MAQSATPRLCAIDSFLTRGARHSHAVRQGKPSGDREMCLAVRELDIFIINLIQKYNISRFVTAYMCMCISLTNTTTCRHDIQMDTVKAQNTVITDIRLSPAEGPMPRTSEAH